jgi:transcriptional regulator with XRE-family HTH domain
LTGIEDRQQIQIAIGNRIRQAREQLGITQEKLADLVGRNQRSISQLENGERNLPASDILIFADVLRVPIEFFYADLLPIVDTGQDADLTALLLAEFQRLPTPSLKQAAITLVRTLKEAILHPR